MGRSRYRRRDGPWRTSRLLAHGRRPPPDPRADRPPLRALPDPDVDTTDWPAQAADTIERAVQGVRDKTTGPAITVARWLVAGLFLADRRASTAAILLSIALVRVLDVYLPESVFGETHVWAAYLLLGLPLFVAGWSCWRKRHTPDPDAS